jgi:hypothetical protein
VQFTGEDGGLVAAGAGTHLQKDVLVVARILRQQQQAQPPYTPLVQMVEEGSRSALSWDQENPNHLWIGHRDKPNETLMKDPSLMDPTARTFAHYPGGHPEGYPDGPRNLFRNLYRYIAAGKKPGKDQADFPTATAWT